MQLAPLFRSDAACGTSNQFKSYKCTLTWRSSFGQFRNEDWHFDPSNSTLWLEWNKNMNNYPSEVEFFFFSAMTTVSTSSLLIFYNSSSLTVALRHLLISIPPLHVWMQPNVINLDCTKLLNHWMTMLLTFRLSPFLWYCCFSNQDKWAEIQFLTL